MRRNLFFVKEIVVTIRAGEDECDEDYEEHSHTIDIPPRDAEDEAIAAICAQSSHEAIWVEYHDEAWHARDRELKMQIATAISRMHQPTQALGEADMEIDPVDDVSDVSDIFSKLALCA
jgi:hypothetical protein